MSNALSWTLGVLSVLDNPTLRDDAAALCASSDGSILYGYTDGGGFASKAVRWDGTAATLLDDVAPSGFSTAYACSPDGSIVAGSANSLDGTYGACRWTGGGATGAYLPATGTFARSAIINPLATGVPLKRIISDDSTIIVGRLEDDGAGIEAQAAYWTNGTPTLLPFLGFGVTNFNFATGCDTTGTIIVGYALGGGSTAVFWDSGTGYYLAQDGFLTDLGTATMCIADGSLIFGSTRGPTGDEQPVYWDDLGTTVDDLTGVIHYMDGLPGVTTTPIGQVFYCADVLVGGQPVSVGFAYDADGNYLAVRWTGTTIELLDPLPGGTFAQATSCSADGSIVSGYADDADGTEWPVYWDAAGAITILPPNNTNPTESNILAQAYGVSLDGLVFFGWGFPPAPPAELKLVSLYPMNEPDDIYGPFIEDGSDWPEAFSQFSISVWCCETVNIQGPRGATDSDPSFAMNFQPTQATFHFENQAGDVLFTGTFNNPGDAPNQYNICFSVDTIAQTYTFRGNGAAWTPVGVSFPNSGEINNIS